MKLQQLRYIWEVAHHDLRQIRAIYELYRYARLHA